MRSSILATGFLVAASAAWAQNVGKRADPPRGQLEANFLEILSHPIVERDLKLSDEQVKQVRVASDREKAVQKELEMRRPENRKTEQREKLRQQMIKARSDANATVDKILDAVQQQRFLQIRRQLQGPSAFVAEPLASELGLTQKQLENIREIEAWFRQQQRKVFLGERAEGGKTLKELRKERDEKILKLLAAAQLKKWETLTGTLLHIEW